MITYTSSNIKRWTRGAKECYRRGCICKGCPLYEQFFKYTPCDMKKAVIATVRILGLPDDLVKSKEENIRED